MSIGNIRLHHLPGNIKALVFAFVVVLSIGFYTGLNFVKTTTHMSGNGIESHYLGNENDDSATVMKFKKSRGEVMTVIHNHMLSMGLIFFCLGLIVSATTLNKKLKYFLMIEPFFSIVLTFGGIYLLWLGITWFTYVIIISGILMTMCFAVSTFSILYEILYLKKQRIE